MVTASVSTDPQGVDPSAAPILELEGVSKTYGGVRALTDVSLSLRSGAVTALVGDNGAGKSTLVKVISGIVAPDEGVMRWRGEPVDIRSPHDATALGIQTVYQDLALCDNLDTVGNLFLGRELRGSGWIGRRLRRPAMEQRTRSLLHELGVTVRNLKAPVGTLSGGQRQSVAVARSVLWNPQLVLLDEPTAALGVAQRKQVLRLIDRLRQQRRSVLVISHDLHDVQQVADRIVVLRLGRKVAEHTAGSYTHHELLRDITGVAEPSSAGSDAGNGVAP